MLTSAPNQTMAIRHLVSNCSSNNDPLEDVRRMGFTESEWNSRIANMILDDLFVEYESFFPNNVEKRKWTNLRSFRKRRRAKALLRDLLGCQRVSLDVVALASNLSVSRDVTLPSFRLLALQFLNSPTTDGNGTIIRNLQLDTSSENVTALFQQHLLSALLAVIDGFVRSGTCPTNVANKLISPFPSDLVRICHRTNNCVLRKFVVDSLVALLAHFSDMEHRQQLHRIIYTALLLLLPSESSDPALSRLALSDVDLFSTKTLRGAAYILLHLDPFALSSPSFVWACQIVLGHWSQFVTETSAFEMPIEMLLIRSFKWLHAALMFMLTLPLSASDSDVKTIISFVSTVFVFANLPSQKFSSAQEQTNPRQAFESALFQLVTSLRQSLFSTSSLTANRLLAPFRQFSSRCQLVAKISYFSASSNSPQLHPVGQCLLCLFVVLSGQAHALCPAILDSLLGSELAKPSERLLAMFEATDIVMKIAANTTSVTDKSAETNLLIGINDRRYELRMFLRTLVGHYVGNETALREAGDVRKYSEAPYYDQIDGILSINE